MTGEDFVKTALYLREKRTLAQNWESVNKTVHEQDQLRFEFNFGGEKMRLTYN